MSERSLEEIADLMRQKARECRNHSEGAISAEERVLWTQMAQEFMKLADDLDGRGYARQI
jgi:hypothetical protein